MAIKAGIEIHQRLNTGKLFCRCPSILCDEKPLFSFFRRLHAVASELGEVDIAAEKESERARLFEYQVYPRACCLVEMDEEPPSEMDKTALKVALEIAQALNADIVDEIHVMRKIVLDGSNTSGFQRTALIAMNGYIETSKGRVGIESIALEEESAGIVAREGGKAVYRLDRLGIPLVEISTSPDIKDGAHLKETAEKIGMLLRMSPYVARGLGTIRQDVNISVEGGARVEIKGAQDLHTLPLLLEKEVRRQKALLEIIEEVKKRGARPGAIKEVTDLFKDTSSKIVKNRCVFGLEMKGFEGLLGKELYEGRRFGTELSDYAKSMGVRGIIHSDEDLAKYGFSSSEIASLRASLGNCFVLVAGEEGLKALEEVKRRASMLFVPKETRKANADGSTSYMRPLPGRARLYPETDIPPIATAPLLPHLTKLLTPQELEKTLEQQVGKEFAKKLIKSHHLHLFLRLSQHYPPKLVASLLENTLVALRREGVMVDESLVKELLSLYAEEKIVKSAFPDILAFAAKHGLSVKEAVERLGVERIKGSELKRLVEREGRDFKKIISKYRLRVDPKELKEMIG